jgi:hypothetical protein
VVVLGLMRGEVLCLASNFDEVLPHQTSTAFARFHFGNFKLASNPVSPQG